MFLNIKYLKRVHNKGNYNNHQNKFQVLISYPINKTLLTCYIIIKNYQDKAN